MDEATLNLLKTVGISVPGIGVIAFVIWQSYLKVKQQMKEDSKGDKIDDRIDKYATNLQTTVDKLILKIDDLQKSRDSLVTQCAQLTADLTIAKHEADSLKFELTKNISRNQYLEGLLKDKGINYVQQSGD